MDLAVNEHYFRQPLPAVPDWFNNELSKVATRNGKPVFRLVDGLRETHIRRGKETVKHPFMAPAFCVSVTTTRFRRKFASKDEFKLYTSWAEADADETPDLLKDIEAATRNLGVMNIGRPCWIIEVYVSPDEINAAAWEQNRFKMLAKSGIMQSVDLLGPFPRDGYYIACFDVVDDDGNAVSPSQKTIDECKRRWKAVTSENETVEKAIQGSHEAIERFEEKQLQEMNENFVQFHGIVGQAALREGVIGKPILKEFASVV